MVEEICIYGWVWWYYLCGFYFKFLCYCCRLDVKCYFRVCCIVIWVSLSKYLVKWVVIIKKFDIYSCFYYFDCVNYFERCRKWYWKVVKVFNVCIVRYFVYVDYLCNDVRWGYCWFKSVFSVWFFFNFKFWVIC